VAQALMPAAPRLISALFRYGGNFACRLPLERHWIAAFIEGNLWSHAWKTIHG